MNKEQRIQEMISLYQKINPAIKVTQNTKIKGTTIERLCEYAGAGYNRVRDWCIKANKQNAPQTIDTQYETGSKRDGQDHKLNFMSYFYPDFLMEYGHHMKKGEIRHGAANFKNGMPPKEVFQSLFRHIMAVWMELEYGRSSNEFKIFCEIERLDPEEVHEAAIVFNAMQIWKWKGGKFEEKLKELNK